MTECEYKALQARVLDDLRAAEMACRVLKALGALKDGDVVSEVQGAVFEASERLLHQFEPVDEAQEALLLERARGWAREALRARLVHARGDFLAQPLFEQAEHALVAFAAGLVQMRCAFEYAEDEVDARLDASQPPVEFAQVAGQTVEQRIEL